MSQAAKIEDIMRFLDTEEASSKTAAAAPAPVAQSDAAPAMQAALADVMASIGGSKTASEAAPAGAPPAAAAAPVNDLVKMANEIVAIDREGEVKHAQLIGAAMADAFVARIGQWEKAAAAVDAPSEKTASEAELLEKFAQAAPQAYQAAVSQGYAHAKDLIEKMGQDLYARSFEAEKGLIEKRAAEHFVHGWNAIAAADRLLAAQQGK